MSFVPYLFTDLSSVISTAYRPAVISTLNRRSTVFKTLRVSPVTAPAEFWDIGESGMIAETFSDGDDVSTDAVDAVTKATLLRGLVRVNFSLGDEAIAAARLIPAGPGSLMDLMGFNYAKSLIVWASAVNAKLFTSSSGVIGFNTALDITGSYAGIDRTTLHTTFRGNRFDPGTLTAPSLKLIRGDISDIYDACGESPDLAFAPSAVWNKIASLFDDVRRYTVDTVSTARGLVQLDGSASGIVIDGCTILKDKDHSAAKMTYVNSRYAEIKYLNMAPPQNMDMASRVGIADDGYGQIPVGLYCKHLGAKGAAERFTTMGSVQLVVTSPITCGQRHNILTT